MDKETKQFKKVPQYQIRVGDIVRIEDGQAFPADLMFIRSEEEKTPKTCWINTKSLDGETDNKLRQAVKVCEWMNEFMYSVHVNVMVLKLTKMRKN